MVRQYDLNEILMTYESLPLEKKETYIKKTIKRLMKAPEEIQEEIMPELERIADEDDERMDYLYEGINHGWYA